MKTFSVCLKVWCSSFLILLLAANSLVMAQDRGAGNVSKQTKSAEKRIALVIGNAAYTKGKPLDNPANDAADMTATLKTLGFEVFSGTDLNKRGIETLIRQFGSRLAETKGVGLFYYAGHGLQVAGENYLVPIDADIPEADEVQYQAVPMNLVLSKMNSAGNDLNIVILDACRNNPFARGWRSFRDTGESDGLARITPPQGTIVLYATQPGNVASDGTGRNGLFTESLLQQIKKPNVELDQMIKALTRDVSEKSSKKQFPWREGGSTGDFYFATTSTAVTQLITPMVILPKVTTLIAPIQISPLDGAVFDIYPRRTKLIWEVVKGAKNYKVEIGIYFQNNETYIWGSARTDPFIVNTNELIFNFNGAQPGRWRVWAIDAYGEEGPKSSWRTFEYKK